MAYQTRCPECQAKLRLDDTPAADEEVECPKCGRGRIVETQFRLTLGAAGLVGHQVPLQASQSDDCE